MTLGLFGDITTADSRSAGKNTEAPVKFDLAVQ